MLKNKNNFEIINLFFHCYAGNLSDHPRMLDPQISDSRKRASLISGSKLEMSELA
jgi:hypothetical protein